jgi:hypothetical protein
MDGSALVWTLNGQPAQKVELHMGDSAAASTWASESGGGVTVSVAKALPKPSLPPAQWLGNKAKQAIQVAVPLYPTASNRGSSGVYPPPDAPGLLAKAYTGALSLAAERDLRRIALPALGCAGRHGWPAEKAARLAVRCCVLGAITAQMTTIAFFLEDPDSAKAWIAAVQEEVSAGTLAEAALEPEEDRAPGWRFRLAERRQREAEEEAEAARAARVAAKKAQLQPEPEPEPDSDQERDQGDTGAAPQNPDVFVDDSSDEDEDEDEDEDAEHDAEEGEHDAEDFIAAAPLVAVLQPAATSAAVAPPLAAADDPDGSAAFAARLGSLADDPMQVELALMARRYHESWRVLRTQPDLTVSFLFVPSDPDFLPVFRKRLQRMTESAGAGADSKKNLKEIGLSLELTLPENYPNTAARIAVSGPAGIPAAHRDAVASLAQDFLTAELIEDSPAQQRQREGGAGAGGGGDSNSVNEASKRRRRPGLRAMVRHLDRQISTAWEEAEEEAGRPKVKIAWVDAPAEHDEQIQQQAPSSSLDDDEDDEDEVLVELWDPERHAVFQDALKAVGKETKGDAKWEAVAAGMAARAANTPSVSGAVIAAASAPECKAYFSLVKQHIKLKKKRAERAAQKAQRQQQREQEGESAETAKPPATMSPQQQQQQQQQQRSTTAALRVSLQGLELQGLVVLHAVRMLLRVGCKRCKTVAEATLSEVRATPPHHTFFALPFLGVETILAETGSGQTERNLKEEVVCFCPCRTPLGQHRAPSAAQRWISCSRRNCAMW